MDDLVKIGSFTDDMEFNMITLSLSNQNVEYWTLDKKDNAFHFLGYTELYVRSKDVDKAALIIKESLPQDQ